MTQPSIEKFKRRLLDLNKELALAAGQGSRSELCPVCRPAGDRLREVVEAPDKSTFSSGGRNSTKNFKIGDLKHIFAHADCPLCALVIRLILRLKAQQLYDFLGRTGGDAVAFAVGDVRNAMERMLNEYEKESDEASSSDSSSDNMVIIHRESTNVQVSVDALPSTGAISVWLPLEHSDETNDEESQFFMHRDDYHAHFGNAPGHIFLPLSDNGAARGMAMIGRCFDICRSPRHAQCTHAPGNISPRRLVDVDDMKIVEIPASSFQPYFALSYVWGRNPFLTLTRSNLSLLCEKNALRYPSFRLPKTITDAIEVTRMLRCRYVWIDSLCIVQDDIGDKMEEIKRMHVIYGSALLTIVAATGDSADASLLDIDPRFLSNDLHSFAGQRIGLDRPEFKQVVNLSTWATRGWTLQELVCSSRLLYFTPERTYYACRTGNWNEDFPVDDGLDMELYENHLRDDDPKGLAFGTMDRAATCYLALVELMSGRQFTREDDVLKALAGLYTSYIHSHLGTAVSGLPATYFEAALMWQPAGRLRRRQSSANASPLPTWSWTGWVGPVTYPFFELDSLEVSPIVRWHLYVRAEPTLSAKYGLVCPRIRDPPAAKTTSSTWSIAPTNLAGTASAGPLAGMFDHEQEPKLEDLPLLLEDTILACRAAAHEFSLMRIPGPESTNRSEVCFFMILAEEGGPVGELKVDGGTLETFFGWDEPFAAELVAIAHLDFATESASNAVYLNRHSRAGQFSVILMDLVEKDAEMVVVMWIHRQGGIAYRVGVGCITKPAGTRSFPRRNGLSCGKWLVLGERGGRDDRICCVMFR